MVLKLTAWGHIKPFRYYIVFFFIMLYVTFFSGIWTDLQGIMTLKLAMILFVPFLVMSLPSLYLHYYEYNKDTIFTITKEGIEVANPQGSTFFEKSSLKSFEFVNGSKIPKARMYRFTRVTLTSGKDFVISSLYAQSAEKILLAAFPQIPFVYSYDYFPTIR
jgi:hypothetical protein